MSFESPSFYSTFLFILASITTTINLFGCYCILFQTPDSMKSVKWTMLNLHVCSSIVDFSLSVIVQPYYLGSTWAWLPLGIGVPLGIPYTVLISVTGTAFLITGVAVIALFENQFYLLFAENTWWRYGRLVFLGINYLVAILYIIDVLMAIPDQPTARAYIFRVHPEFRLFDSPERPIQVAVAHDDSSMGTRQMLMTMMILFEGLGFPIILSFKMNNIGRTSNLTQNTVKLKKKFLNRIYIQVSLPLLVVLIPSTISVFSGILGITPQIINNLVHICFSIHGMTSTLIMVSIQKPYRQFFLKILRPRYFTKKITVKTSMINFEPMTRNPTMF